MLAVKDVLLAVKDAAKKVQKAAEKNFASDVGGGMASQMDRFFPDNGFFRLSNEGTY